MADQIGNFIICPYCDYIFPDMCDYPEEKDIVDGIEMECENCERKFMAIGECSWTFQTYEKSEMWTAKLMIEIRHEPFPESKIIQTEETVKKIRKALESVFGKRITLLRWESYKSEKEGE